MEAHMDQMADLVQKLSSELRSGLQPAYENFMGFFHAINWKVNFKSLYNEPTNLQVQNKTRCCDRRFSFCKIFNLMLI